MAPPIRPPWDGPAAHSMLDAKAPQTSSADRETTWLGLLRAALTAHPRMEDACESLGIAPRTLAQWLARLRAEYPNLADTLPKPKRGGARPGAGRPAK